MDPAQLLASFKHVQQRLSQNFQDRLAMDRPVYSTPPPVESTPQNNECRLVEVHGHKIAAFTINHEEYICLPQAFEIFLKHLVGGLHTVYTKLKRLSITPLVCNVEQVRTLRGLGAIQPGVNRCKLITRRDFETLYQDCTTSSRPGRPPKRFLPPHFSPTPPILGATPPKMPKTSFEESLPTATIDEFKGDDDETSNKAGSDEEITTSPTAQAISTSAPALPGAQSGIYAKAQEALRAHYQHMGLPPHPLLANPLLQLGAQNGTAAQNGVPPTSAPVNVGAAFGAAGAALGLPTPLMAAQMRGAENGIDAGKKENQNNAYPNCSPRSPSERATAARRVPEMLERLDEMISEPEESESILVLASKLATYAAENARKRNQEARAELEKLRELYENERRQRESAEKKLEQSAKSSRRLFRIIKNLRQSRGIAGAKNEESPSKFSRSSAEEVVDEDENYSPSCGGNLTIHSQVEFHKIQQPHVA